MVLFSCFRLIFPILWSLFMPKLIRYNFFGNISTKYYHRQDRTRTKEKNCLFSVHRNLMQTQVSKILNLIVFSVIFSPCLSGVEASSDQVQLKGGGDFRDCRSTWKPPGSAVQGWRSCKLADQAPQAQTFCVQEPRERALHKSGTAHSRIHRNIQVLLHWWIKVSELDLLRPCLC